MQTLTPLPPITDEQRAANKAKRLKAAADPNDGLTVRLLFDQRQGQRGDCPIVRRGIALQLIKEGKAEIAEPEESSSSAA